MNLATKLRKYIKQLTNGIAINPRNANILQKSKMGLRLLIPFHRPAQSSNSEKTNNAFTSLNY